MNGLNLPTPTFLQRTSSSQRQTQQPATTRCWLLLPAGLVRASALIRITGGARALTLFRVTRLALPQTQLIRLMYVRSAVLPTMTSGTASWPLLSGSFQSSDIEKIHWVTCSAAGNLAG